MRPVKIDHTKIIKQKKIVSKEFKVINTSLKLSKTLKSNKELTYRILAQSSFKRSQQSKI